MFVKKVQEACNVVVLLRMMVKVRKKAGHPVQFFRKGIVAGDLQQKQDGQQFFQTGKDINFCNKRIYSLITACHDFRQ